MRDNRKRALSLAVCRQCLHIMNPVEMPSPPHSPPASSAGRKRWIQHLPYLSLALFLAAIAALVWLTRTYDSDEQRTTLINDVLWMEQNLRFHLDRNEIHLQEIGRELFADRPHAAETEARLASLLSQERGLVQILWLSADGSVLGAMPPHPGATASTPGDAARAVSETTFQLARSVGRPAYGPTYPVMGNRHHFEVHVPIWSEDSPPGVVVGVYSLTDLVVRELPWWFSERYRVAVLDADGREIAAAHAAADEACEFFLQPLATEQHAARRDAAVARGGRQCLRHLRADLQKVRPQYLISVPRLWEALLSGFEDAMAAMPAPGARASPRAARHRGAAATRAERGLLPEVHLVARPV